MDNYRRDYVLSHFTVLTFFVNKPGDLSDRKRLEKLNGMVAELESRPDSWGPVATKYFVRDFMIFEQTLIEEKQDSNSNAVIAFDVNDLKGFVDWPEYHYWKGFFHLGKNAQNQT